MNIIFKRKSVRTYLDIDVDDVTVEQIIRAGMAAPSAKNQRPWEFYVVRNKETLAKLATCTPYARPVANAPVAIVACYRLPRWRWVRCGFPSHPIRNGRNRPKRS